MTNIDLFQVVRGGDLSTLLSQCNGQLDEKDEDGQSLLHEAIAYGSDAIAIELISRGINLNSQDRNGQTPLHYVAKHKDLRIARDLLSAGADLGIRDSHGNSPMWTAVFNARGKYDLVELFLEFDGSAEHRNHAGRTPLDFAKQIQDEALTEILRQGIEPRF